MAHEQGNFPDPLIDEVRRRRQELFADHDNDLNKLYDAIKRLQAEHPEKLEDRRKRRTTLLFDEATHRPRHP